MLYHCVSAFVCLCFSGFMCVIVLLDLSACSVVLPDLIVTVYMITREPDTTRSLQVWDLFYISVSVIKTVLD